MTAAARRGIGLLVAGALVVCGGLLAQRSEMIDALDTQAAVADGLASQLSTASGDGARLGAGLADVRALTTVYAVLVDRRGDFVSSIADVSRVFAAASGKVDTSSQRAQVLEAQERVLAEREDAATVVDAVAEVDGIAASVTQAVAAYDAEQQRLAAEAAARAARTSGAAWSAAPPATGSAYDRVRAALDRVGGAGVPLQEFGGSCAGGFAAACASSTGVIFFTAALAGWSDSRLHWAMAHELAHIRQFRIWGQLQASGAYAALYGGNIELLANCMAAQRGYPSGAVSCSGAQIDFGAAIWNGYVPG